MEIITKKVKDLKPYEKNPRKNSGAVEAVANSIRDFGFKVPIIIDKDNVIVCGHTRLKAAKKLKLKEVPCIIADAMSEEQIKAFRLADNKVGEISEWDFDLLDEELADILDFDMEDYGFEYDEDEGSEDNEKDEGEEHFGDERERTFNEYNLDDFDRERCAGKYEMPVIRAVHDVPADMISFNYMLSKDSFDKWIHFYIDDYQFERIWNSPETYIERLQKFAGALTPDFSLYTEMPIAMQIWNTYRSRLIGQIMQDYGIKVIPTLSWCRENSFDFCFDGIEPGGTVSVSTIGVKDDEEAKRLWFSGMDEAIRRIKPTHVVVYGGDIGYKFQCGVQYISNHNSEGIRCRYKGSEV